MSNPFKSEGRFVQKVEATPLVEVRLEPGGAGIWCKLEFLNPSGSTKDRIARYMVEKAWRDGRIKEGGTVVEATGREVVEIDTCTDNSAARSTTVVGVEARSSTRILAPSGKTCRSTNSTAVFAT